MNATEQAYELLGADGYEAMCLEVLCTGGTMVQDKEFLAAWRMEGDVAHVLFACGNLRKLREFARALAGVYGCRRMCWVRRLVGKREEMKFYDIERI